MVAKSYQSFEIIEGPYSVSGKQYVKVKNPKTSTIRQARWYSDKEYAKMYPDEAAVSRSTDPYFKTQKEVLGFTNGYITIFKGDTYTNLEWFQLSIARYAKWWGWYIISTEEIPEDLPEGLEPIQLPWELVGNDDGKLKADTAVKTAVESLIYEAGDSEYVGAIGDRLELYLTVEKVIELEGEYGHSSMHLMRDDCGNLFVWTTAAKTWTVGKEYHLKGTVKDHRTYRAEAQTVLTRCIEINN